jgi:hypothetical protein
MLTFIFLFCESSWPGVPRLKTLGMQHIPAYFPQLRAVLPICGSGSFHIDADPDPNLEPAPCQSYAGLWFTAPWLHFEPPCLASIVSVHDPPQLLNRYPLTFIFFVSLLCQGSSPQDFRHATDSRLFSSIEGSVADPHHINAVPDPFTLMQIRIRIWSLLLVKVMRICGH